MKDNIVLVGMPASGKTTIGNLLAEKLNDYILFDIDSVIEKTCEIDTYKACKQEDSKKRR